MDPKFFDDLAKKLSEMMPEGAHQIKKDMEKNFRSALEHSFQKLNLVTREEFDVQSAVLERTRKKISALEKKVKELEGKDKPTSKK